MNNSSPDRTFPIIIAVAAFGATVFMLFHLHPSLSSMQSSLSSMQTSLSLMQSKDKELRTLQAIYDSQDQGLSEGKTGPALSSMTPDYVYIREDGTKETSEQLRGEIRGLVEHAVNIHSKSFIKSILLDRNFATVVVKSHLSCELYNTALNPVPNQTVEFDDTGLSREVWTKSLLKGWACEKTRELYHVCKVNGCPIAK